MKNLFLILAVLTLLPSVGQESTLNIVRRPALTRQVSSRSEGAWTTCRLCQGKVRYQRTWKRVMSDGSWRETTEKVPEYCRDCEKKVREIDKYRAEEARLDLKLEKKEAKARIREKRERLYSR